MNKLYRALDAKMTFFFQTFEALSIPFRLELGWNRAWDYLGKRGFAKRRSYILILLFIIIALQRLISGRMCVFTYE